MTLIQNPSPGIAKSMRFLDCRASPNRFLKQSELECKHSARLIAKICWLLNSYKSESILLMSIIVQTGFRLMTE